MPPASFSICSVLAPGEGNRHIDAERRVQCRIDRRRGGGQAAAEIDADNRIVGICGRVVAERQARRVIDANEGERLWLPALGDGDLDRVTRYEVGHIQIEAGLRPHRCGTAGHLGAGKAQCQPVRQFIQLRLSLHQRLIAQLSQRCNFAAAELTLPEEIQIGSAKGRERDRSNAPLGIVRAVD